MQYHIHHIIPRHAGGTDDPTNLVSLTVEEHANAHKLLYEEFGRTQDKVAWLSLSGQLGKLETISAVRYLGSKKGARASGDRARALFESGDAEYIERMAKQKTDASKRYKELYEEHGGIWWTSGFKDKEHSEETLAKMRGKRPQSSGSKNSQYGKCWITKDQQNMLIHKEHLPEYIKDGWITGRVTKFGQVAQLVETRKI